jgi:hypothetical protein
MWHQVSLGPVVGAANHSQRFRMGRYALFTAQPVIMANPAEAVKRGLRKYLGRQRQIRIRKRLEGDQLRVDTCFFLQERPHPRRQ